MYAQSILGMIAIQKNYYWYNRHFVERLQRIIGISPSGAIVFISDLDPGRISDKELTRRSGLVNFLDPGDAVIADRGFDIEEDLVLQC